MDFSKITNQSLLAKYNQMFSTLIPNLVGLSAVQASQLQRAREFCWDIFHVPKDTEVHISDNLGSALAVAYSEKIYISLKCFDLGTKVVAHALWEEWLHLTTGMQDETREMQNYLFQKSLSLGEQIKGQAL